MIDAVIARLEAEAASLVTVDHAFFMEPVDDLAAEVPAVYAYPGDEIAARSAHDNVVVQQVTEQIALVIVCPVASFVAIRDEVRGALLGYQPAANLTDLEYVSGKPLDIRGDYLWYRQTYITEYHIRQS